MLALLLLLLTACPTASDDDDVAATDDDDATDDGTWRSTLYPEDWTPGHTDAEGRFLHDFSYAGYRYGEPLPDLPTPINSVLDHGADPTGVADSCPAIQATIDATPTGTILLPAGEYRCDGLLRITTSNTVLAGEGSDKTFLFFTRAEGMTDTAHLSITGTVSQAADVLLPADVPALATDLDLPPGTDVALGHVITDAFVEAHQMTDTWGPFNGQWQTLARRTVQADGSLDVPLRSPLLTRDAASYRVETGTLHEVGVQDLAISTVVDWDAAWANDRSHAIKLNGVADAWVRNVASYESPNSRDAEARHLQSGGIEVSASKRVTVADCALGPAQNRGGGGNGYLFEITRSNEVLIVDSIGTGGRHNFIQNWGFGTSGCVFLRTHSRDGFAASDDSELFGGVGLSEFHHSLATANLIDRSIADDGWGAVNRQNWSSGAGHSATQNVFWNLAGSGVVRSYQHGWGYVIGTTDITIETSIADDGLFSPGEFTEPDDHVEGPEIGALLRPLSLYEDQRVRRMRR